MILNNDINNVLISVKIKPVEVIGLKPKVTYIIQDYYYMLSL